LKKKNTKSTAAITLVKNHYTKLQSVFLLRQLAHSKPALSLSKGSIFGLSGLAPRYIARRCLRQFTVNVSTLLLPALVTIQVLCGPVSAPEEML